MFSQVCVVLWGNEVSYFAHLIGPKREDIHETKEQDLSLDCLAGTYNSQLIKGLRITRKANLVAAQWWHFTFLFPSSLPVSLWRSLLANISVAWVNLRNISRLVGKITIQNHSQPTPRKPPNKLMQFLLESYIINNSNDTSTTGAAASTSFAPLESLFLSFFFKSALWVARFQGDQSRSRKLPTILKTSKRGWDPEQKM